LKVLVRFLVPENPLGDLEQPPEFDQGGNAGTDRRLERLFTRPAESEGAQAGLVGDAEQVIAFREGANGTAFAFGKTALGPLHQTAAPCVGRGVSDGSESHQSGRGGGGAAGQGKGRLKREPVWINEPRSIVFEKDGLCASNAIAPRQSDRARAAVQVDMHFEVSHRATTRLSA
jgi:hypothetical protein